MSVFQRVHMPSLGGATEWLNSEPLGPAALRAASLPEQTETERRGMQTAELSNAMVAIYKEQFGRGPTKAHSVYATKDLLVCTLEESLTPSERKMLAFDEHRRVREIRMFFQHAVEKEFVETVERVTGRQVRGFVSGIDTHKDISTEVFYLEPAAPTG